MCRNTELAKVTCALLFAPGTWSVSGTTVSYALSRDHLVYARGAMRLGSRRAVQLPLKATRRLRSGRYLLTLELSRGGRRTAARLFVTVR